MPKFNRGDIITYNRQAATDIEDLLTPVGAEVEGVQEERLLVVDYIYYQKSYKRKSNIPSAYRFIWLNNGERTQMSITYADRNYKLVS